MAMQLTERCQRIQPPDGASVPDALLRVGAEVLHHRCTGAWAAPHGCPWLDIRQALRAGLYADLRY